MSTHTYVCSQASLAQRSTSFAGIVSKRLMRLAGIGWYLM